MRIITATALAAVLSLGTPGFVLAQGAANQAEKAPAKSGGQTSAKISSIQVVDIKQLPDAVKKQVEEVVSKSSEEDLKALRASIDASPAAANALKQIRVKKKPRIRIMLTFRKSLRLLCHPVHATHAYVAL